MAAVVLITSEAQEKFDALPLTIRARMEKLLVRLENWPQVSGAKPLSGKLAGHYRMRTGDYRLQFRVESGDARSADVTAESKAAERVIVEKLGHRDGFYDE
jgi:mRNA-degrading endonuclease RelE of RelBE toxin-antitoxin system